MHTTGLLPAGERPQFKMVSLTLQNGAIENSGCIQNFTSWAAKNSADMITTLGRNINSRARSPGPSCTKEGWKFSSPLLMQRVFFFQQRDIIFTGNTYPYLTRQHCRYSMLVTQIFQLVTDGCEWNNDRGCRAWRNFDCSIYFHNQKRSYQEAWGGLSQAWEESCPSQLEHSWVHGCYRLIAWQQLRQPGGTDKNNLRSPIIQCTWKWRISAGSAGWLWWSRLYAS